VRILLDTNVLASSLTTRGLCAELLEHILYQHELLTCEPVLKELRRVLTGKFRLPASLTRDYINLIKSHAVIITDFTDVKTRIKDPDDIPIIGCAVAARADAFVTGDKELLKLRRVETVPVLSPRECWRKLAGLES
jgi:putative PIN family toxin of toxin-antitoxin system